MKAFFTVELDMANVGNALVLDTWAWALERQIEQLATVEKAHVVVSWVEPQLWDDEPPQDRLQVVEP